MGDVNLWKLHRRAAAFATTGAGLDALRRALDEGGDTPLEHALAWALGQRHRRSAALTILADMPFLPDLAAAGALRNLGRKGDGGEGNAWMVGFALEAAVDTLRRAPEVGGPLIEAIERWIARLMARRDSELGRIDVLRGRALPTWGSGKKLTSRAGMPWTAVAARPGRLAYPLLRYVELGLRDAGPGAPSDEAVVAMCGDAVRCFDEDLVWHGAEANLRCLITDGPEVLNHTLSWARAVLVHAEVTGDAEGRRIAEGAAAFFRGCLVEEETGLPAWAYRPSFEDRRHGFPSWIWKANHDLSFAAECHRRGLGFDDADMARFARVFHEVVLARGYVKATMSSRDPIALAERAVLDGNPGSALCGWNVLSEAEPGIERSIALAMAGNPHLVPGFWFSSPRAIGAYARRPDRAGLDPAFPQVAAAWRLEGHRDARERSDPAPSRRTA